MGDCLWAGKLSHYVTSHPGQLSLGIPPWTAREENGEFCVAVAPAPGLLVYWPSWLKALAVKLSRPSGQSGSYTDLIGFNPRWLKGPKRGWAPMQRTYVYAKKWINRCCFSVKLYVVGLQNSLEKYLEGPGKFWNLRNRQTDRQTAIIRRQNRAYA